MPSMYVCMYKNQKSTRFCRAILNIHTNCHDCTIPNRFYLFCSDVIDIAVRSLKTLVILLELRW